MNFTFKNWIERRIAGEEVELNMPRFKQDMNGILLEDAVKAHIAWRENWLNTIRNHKGDQLKPDEVAADNLCKVGKWIYGAGAIYDRYPEYLVVRDIHAKFHQCAGEIVEFHQQKRFTDAMLKSKTELMDLSKKVGLAMLNLCEAIHRE